MAERAQPFDGDGKASPAAVWAALLAVYVVWGSTYLAIRVTVRTIPPLLSASIRFLVAGTLLYLWSVRRGDRDGDRPTGAHWRSAAIIGAVMLFGGNGLVSLAEQTVPSSLAALLLASIPLWMVVIRLVVLREKSGWVEVAGLVLGFGGIVLLVDPFGGGTADPLGVGLLLLAALSWASGSLFARTAALPSRPLVGTGMEMIAGGLVCLVAAVIAGELGDLELARISVPSLLGLAFLIVFGSWVGFAAYVWLLRAARTSLVSTYAYVNPVVAVLLGWAILGEAISARTVIAGAVVLGAVALIVSASPRRAEPAPDVPEADEEPAKARASA
ncbi:MAG TPA: EamA family transporter [Actinomycetota bacterium]|nr:EamA family transporter [Actinomycetota bacterium]